jgi:hypothetical protein
MLAAGLAAALLAAGCAAGGATEAAEHNPPTFKRVKDDTLRFTEPVSTVSDLQAPAKEGHPWRIVGSVLEPSNNRSKAAVWSSKDGRTWERDEIDPRDSGVSEAMASVAYRGDHLIAVGRVTDDDESDAAIWSSTADGWELTTPEEMGGKHDQWAFDVAVGSSGVLVVGGETAWGEVRPRLWFSADGKSWKTVDGGPGGALDQTGEESIQDITAFGGGFVAVGWRDVEGEQNGVAWFSADGTSWEEIDAPTLGSDNDGRQSLQSVVAIQDRLVAGGFRSDPNGQGRPVMWTSTDGHTWSEPQPPLATHDNQRNAGSDMSVRALSVVGSAILAAGGDDWRPHLWQSNDAGATWQLLPDVSRGTTFEDGVALDDVAGSGKAVLALGTEPVVMELLDGRWLDQTGDNFPTGGGRPAATSVVVDDDVLMTTGYSYRARTRDTRRYYPGRIWVRRGGDLTEIKPKEPTEGQQVPQSEPNQTLFVGKVNDVVPFDGGYVAVGFEDFAWAAQRKASDTKPDGVIWTSKDGRQWNRQAAALPDITNQAELIAFSIDNPDTGATAKATAEVVASQPLITNKPAGGQGTRSLEAVAPLGKGFIAVGSAYRDLDGQRPANYDMDPIVAVSDDGVAIRDENPNLGDPNSTQRFRDVCVHDGQAIAVGVSGTDNGYDVAVRLRDRNGGWHPGEATDESFGGNGSQQAFSCAASKDGYVIVGSDNRRGNADARIWVSEDGLEWHQLSASSLGGTGDQEARAVAAVPDGGWLLGGIDTMGGDSDAALWRIDENDTITRRDRDEPSLGGPGTQSVTGIHVTDKKVVVVGEDQAGVGIWESKKLDR